MGSLLMESCFIFSPIYTRSYIGRSEEFLNIVEGFLKKSGKLSVKQRKALNQMYKRFKKRVEKKGISNVQIEMK